MENKRERGREREEEGERESNVKTNFPSLETYEDCTSKNQSTKAQKLALKQPCRGKHLESDKKNLASRNFPFSLMWCLSFLYYFLRKKNISMFSALLEADKEFESGAVKRNCATSTEAS